jgi:putative membrane protein insertion efficiency factor
LQGGILKEETGYSENTGWLASLLIQLITAYQKLAPDFIRDRCRYAPSCSTYSKLALKKHGAWKGLLMTLERLKRCRPPNGGEDYP